jgi:tRNA A37 methylthiotransferase MiaB
MKYFVKTYGYHMNGADSEVMERLLEREGVAPIHRSVLSEGADVVILKKNN